MPSVVFLRAINVGGGNLCKPAQLAKDLKKFDIVNIGAVGTFVVRDNVPAPALRDAFARRLVKDFGIKCEIMIVPSRDVMKLAAKDPFAGHPPAGPDITRFVSVLHKPVSSARIPVRLGLNRDSLFALPSDDDWLLRIIRIEKQFVIGVYKRQMKAIGYLGKIEKILGVPGTVRNWNTIQKVVQVLSDL